MDRWLAGLFLSTLSLRRATRGISSGIAETAIFYPRSPCGERPFRLRSFLDLVLFLSTLSLRRATYDTYAKVLRVNFSIHALLAESDASHTNSPSKIINFLSTLSLRRATTAPRTGLTCGGGFFYPRSPCGERRKRFPLMCFIRLFYPRSPCGERPTTTITICTA